MIIRECTLTNSRGDSIDFASRYKLIEGLDLSGLKASVNYAQTTGDGAMYQNTRLNVREFDLTFFINYQYAENSLQELWRQRLFTVLNPKFNPFKMSFLTKGGEEFYINVNLATAPQLPQGFDNENRAWQKGLLQFLSTDPFIYSANASFVELATWKPLFEFPLDIPPEGIEMGSRSLDLIGNVFNEGQETTGMSIRFIANSEVLNPSLLNINTYESLKLNFRMQLGDVIEVNTKRGQRSVRLTRNNVTTNIFNAFDLNSTFLQLEPGDNLFRYDADEGLEFLNISISFEPQRIGV